MSGTKKTLPESASFVPLCLFDPPQKRVGKFPRTRIRALAKKKVPATPRGKKPFVKVTPPKKEVKQAAKNVKRNVRAVAKQIKSVSNAASKKAPATSKKAPAKKAPAKKATSKKAPAKKAPAKQSRKSLASKASYSLRDLPIKGRSFFDLTLDLENKADSLDKLKKEDEYFIATYYGNRTKAVYENMGTLASQLVKYASKNEHGQGTDAEGREAIQSVRIMRYKDSSTKYKSERKETLQKRETFRKDVNKQAVEKYGSTDKATKKKNSYVDFLRLAMEENAKLQKELAQSKKQRKSSAKKSKAKPKSSTKRTSKVFSPKKVVSKNTKATASKGKPKPSTNASRKVTPKKVSSKLAKTQIKKAPKKAAKKAVKTTPKKAVAKKALKKTTPRRK